MICAIIYILRLITPMGTYHTMSSTQKIVRSFNMSAPIHTVTCELLLAAWGVYLVRKAKRPEIEALWDEKWQIPEITDSANSQSIQN